MTSSEAVAPAPDAALVRRCLAGDEDAWTDLYRRYHASLLRHVERLLWPGPDRADRAEEVLARLWYALVRGRGAPLHRFDPARGPLGGLLAAVARQQLYRLCRSARRPGHTLRPLPARDIAAPPAEPVSERVLLEEFVGRLTPTEARFYRERLLAARAGREAPLSGAEEKLRQRVRAKFLRYLQGR
jgi:DNA-directed RNA polymerase specialized sigma24 family protein